MLRFIDEIPGLGRVGRAFGAGSCGRFDAALVAAALSGGSASLALMAVAGVGDPGPLLAVVAVISTALFALTALVLARSTHAADEPARNARPAETFAEKAPHATPPGGLVIDDRSAVLSRFVLPDATATPLESNDRLLDRVHVGDRVAFLRALADARAVDAAPVAVTVRLDRAAPGDPQSFAPVTMILRAHAPDRIEVFMACDVAPAAAPEAAEDRDAARLAMVSHELRTPLNAIIGFADLVRGDTLGALPPERHREYADLIHDAATHLLSVVNAMLDVSKIGSGQYAINREDFDLDRTVRDVATMIAPRARAKSVHVNLHLEKAVLPAHADRRAVRQIVTNLLTNAVKFTPDNGCVTIDAETSPAGLSLTVSDTGIGISPQDLAKLGRPFAQVDNSYTRQCEGTGLGLSLVKGLARLHEGQMRIESTPEIGTRVTVDLPRAGSEQMNGHDQDDRITELWPKNRLDDADQQEEIAHAPQRYG
ncbi:MAG: HAMP domain-containing histidine kinase [Phyllobacteriaceae bacterium]|nr:HAMP domain-containing histidine kinase [Phyllobacteriaceae bacterium]